MFEIDRANIPPNIVQLVGNFFATSRGSGISVNYRSTLNNIKNYIEEALATYDRDSKFKKLAAEPERQVTIHRF
jgi:SNF family Na+-dependent transporter